LTLPQNDTCVYKPELCRAHLGISRDMKWSENHCLINHYVYLAASSEIKVGVTRHTQIPNRWIDQGASSAIVIAQTPNRYLSGLIEVALKVQFTDKTNWQAMLKNKIMLNPDLNKAKQESQNLVSGSLIEYFTEESEIYTWQYPVLSYPDKIKSVDLEKAQYIEGKLIGIKGQYWIFESGNVINIRKYGGYRASLIFC